MSLGSITNTALKALTANQLAMTVASNNIANAQTPEYARQRLVITPSGPGAESFRIGTGVDVVGVQALRDHLVDSRLRQETSAKSGEQALAHALGDVEVLFNDGDDTGLLKSLTDFFNAFHSLSLDTTSMNFREELKMKANTLAGMFSGRNADLKNIQDSADDALAAEVKHVNNLISQIAAVTENIKMQETQHVSHDLRTHRAALVREL